MPQLGSGVFRSKPATTIAFSFALLGLGGFTLQLFPGFLEADNLLLPENQLLCRQRLHLVNAPAGFPGDGDYFLGAGACRKSALTTWLM